jgi:hypothetical protein
LSASAVATFFATHFATFCIFATFSLFSDIANGACFNLLNIRKYFDILNQKPCKLFVHFSPFSYRYICNSVALQYFSIAIHPTCLAHHTTMPVVIFELLLPEESKDNKP